MANEAYSRHTTPFPRWGETAAEVPDASNVVEPSGGKKDTGWVPGVDTITGEWWNWLHWAAGVFFRYLENTLNLMWTRNHVMAGASAGEGEVTAGVGLSVDVAGARCWIQGQMHAVPAATNLALAAADPVLGRRDLIVGRVVALSPVWAVITGTPDASPEAPSAGAGDVGVAEVLVGAAATVPSVIVDVREFGAVDLAMVRANTQLDAGEVSASPGEAVFRVIDGEVLLGGVDDPQMRVSADFSFVQVKPETFKLETAITRKFDIDGCCIISDDTSDRPLTNGSFTLGTSRQAWVPVRVPNGATITAVRVYGTKVSSTDGFSSLELNARLKADGTVTLLFPGVGTDYETEGDPAGAFTFSVTGLSHVVDQLSTYHIEIRTGTGSVTIYAFEVEYTEDHPFDGI